MSYEEAMSAMAKTCKDKPKELSQIGTSTCSLGEFPQDHLMLEFGVHSTQQLYRVRYNFRTAAKVSDVIKSLFAQFGYPCESRPGYETCYPTGTLSKLTGTHLLTLWLDHDLPFENNKCPPYRLFLEFSMYPDRQEGSLILTDTTLPHAEYDALEAPPKF
jgi:hypothetical protein